MCPYKNPILDSDFHFHYFKISKTTYVNTGYDRNIPRSSMLEATKIVGEVVLHWQKLAMTNILVEKMVGFSNKTLFFGLF